MFWLILIAVFLGLLAYLLFATLLVEIDTSHQLYSFSIVPVFRISWVVDEFPRHPEITIFGFRKKLNLQAWFKGTAPKETKVRKPSKFRISFSKIRSLVRSFRVKKWLVNIDTGDMALNGEMFPLMYALMRMTGKEFYINFFGKNEVVITIENNAFRMLKAIIK
jgi:hypothetical protein